MFHGLFDHQGGEESMTLEGVIVDILAVGVMNHGPSMVEHPIGVVDNDLA